MKRRPAWLLAATVMVVAGSPVVLSVEQWTGLDGDYNLPAAPGTYSVTASALGHQSAFQQVAVRQTSQSRWIWRSRPGRPQCTCRSSCETPAPKDDREPPWNLIGQSR